MAAVLSPQTISTSPSPVSLPARLPASSNPNLAQLPPLVTSPPLQPARPPTQRAPSHASQKRMSTYSNTQSRSRPQSTVFPAFHTSLPYALVRDFAYPDSHPLHYGPPPEPPSGLSTPASEYKRRLSDLPETWDSKGHWSAGPWGANEALYGGNQRQTGGGQQLPSTSFTTFSEGDGPPWSEDEDLHSPVVTSSRHKKQKSSLADVEQRRGRSRNSIHAREERQSPYMKRDKGGSASGAHQISGPSASAANGPGVEYITYSPGTLSLSIPSGETNPRRDSHFATLPNRTFHSQSLHESPESDLPEDEDSELDPSEPTESPYRTDEDMSRYSRDYQFTIASPDEEMHGKAIALYEFTRENENELPLVEGQVILVSYRHGEGWLVAQDMKTGDTGLVPEEYVRLLRDIEGGWPGLQPQHATESPVAGEVEALTPVQAEHSRSQSGTSTTSNKAEHYTPVVSTFSTSSKDFEMPQHLFSSTTNTPTLGDGAFVRRESGDTRSAESTTGHERDKSELSQR